MGSPLSQFIIYLHERALADGRVPALTDHELTVLDAIRRGTGSAEDQEVSVGLELYDGRPHSDLARRIQRRAVSTLSDLDLALQNVDEAGYTAINLRSLLSTHFDNLRYAALGSDANCAYLDIRTAIEQASDKTRTVAWLLVAGIGPQELGKMLNTNGSRKINRALAELARILEGRYYAESNRGA